MKQFGKRLLVILMVCCMPLCAFADMGDVGSGLTAFLDSDIPVRMSVGFQIDEMVPYGQSMVDMMGGILKHTTLEAQLEGDNSALWMCVDGKPVFSLTETRDGDQYSLVTDLLPNRVLTSEKSPLEKLFPEEGKQPIGFDMAACAAETAACYQELTDAIIPYAEEKEANYKIDHVGRAKWVRLAKLDEAQTEEMMPLIIKLLGCGMDETFRQELSKMTCRGGMTIALYRTDKDGEDIAIYIKGNVSFGENDNRTVSYLYAFSQDDGQNKQNYRLELLKPKGRANKHLVESYSSFENKGGSVTYSGETYMERKQEDLTLTYSQKDSYKGKAGADGNVSGKTTITFKTIRGDSTVTEITEVKPELKLENKGDHILLSGQVDYSETRSKKPMVTMHILLSDTPPEVDFAAGEPARQTEDEDGVIVISIGGGSLNQNQDSFSQFLVGEPPVGVNAYFPPENEETVDLDTASPETMAALEEELMQYAAGYLLRVLPLIDQEDTTLLQDNMSIEDYGLFYNQVQFPD